MDKKQKLILRYFIAPLIPVILLSIVLFTYWINNPELSRMELFLIFWPIYLVYIVGYGIWYLITKRK